jgi:hypothetical protein
VRLRYESGLITKDRLVLKLNGANSSKANLVGANLMAVDLSRTNLSGADGITREELKRQAAALEGATMPDNQKYKDWPKSKGRGKGRKSSGLS